MKHSRQSSIRPYTRHSGGKYHKVLKHAWGAWKLFANKRKYKGQGSKTQVENRIDQNNNNDIHSGVVKYHANVSMGRKFSKKCIHSAPLRYTEITQIYQLGVISKQTVLDLTSAATVHQMAVGGDTNPTNVRGSVSLLGLNPYQTNTGGDFNNSTVAPRNDALFLSNIHFAIDMTNSSSAGAIVDLYFVTPKENGNLVPSQVWTNELVENRLGNSIVSYPEANTTISTFGYPDINFPGLKPHEAFKKWFKILKVHSLTLAGGASEVCSVNVNTNYMIDMTKLIQAQNFTNADTTLAAFTNNFIKGCTIHVMAVWRGQAVPVDNTSDYAGYAPIEMSFVMKKQYTLKMVAGNASRLGIALASHHAATAGTAKIVTATDVAAAVVNAN